MTYTQSKYQSYTRSSGRVISILDQISPDKIKYFDVINQNADMPMYGIRVHRDDYQRYKSDNFFNPLLTSSEIYSPDRNIEKTHKFDPQAKLPAHFFHVSPSIRSQIGGPDGFYFGDVSIAFHSELLIQENFSLLTIANIGVYDNYGPLKLASDSVLPRVRTDIVKYLKNSKDFRIERLQMNYFNKLSENLYFKLSGGFLEYMFAAAGGEILWRPFYKNYGIGAEIWQAKQRSYDMLFKFSDYDIVTGHINLYFVEPKSRVLVNVKGGRFLAGDSGINLNLSRRFKSGLQLGVFVSKTDISAAEFGEGSFDKGFYFHIPIESFFSNYAKGLTSWGLRPLTRDGAQYLTHVIIFGEYPIKRIISIFHLTGTISMIKRLISIIFMSFLISSCGLLNEINYVDVATEVKNIILDTGDLKITEEYYDNAKASFAKIKFGRGSNYAVVYLKSIENEVSIWESSDKIEVHTFKGKVIKTVGFENDIDIKYFNNFSFEKKEIFNSLSFSNPLLINSPINYSIDFDIVEEIEFLEKERKVSKYVETFIAEDIGWKGKNTYFVDETLNVIRTYQRIGPFKSIVEIEYYYKYN